MSGDRPAAACVRPGVPIDISSFNRASYVRECVESARQQSQHTVEIIIVDDGSSDDTLMVAAAFPGVRALRHHVRTRSAGASRRFAGAVGLPGGAGEARHTQEAR